MLERQQRSATKCERRGADRHLTVLQLATLEANGASTLCLVVNISQMGLKVRCFGHAINSENVRLCFRGNRSFEGKVVWQEGECYGIELAHGLSEPEISAVTGQPRENERAPRLEVNCPVTVRVGARIFRARLCNISPGGAMIEGDQIGVCAGGVTIFLPGGARIRGQVRWAAGDRAGVFFHERLQLRSINQLMA
jgi:hypothetical protein